jgi:hypothetical protein
VGPVEPEFFAEGIPALVGAIAEEIHDGRVVLNQGFSLSFLPISQGQVVRAQ